MNNDDRSPSTVSAFAGARLDRRTLLRLAGAGLVLWATPVRISRGAFAVPAKSNVVLRWNEALLDAIRTKMAPPIAARALAITHTAMYDAWTPYSRRANPTRPGPCRRPKSKRTLANKSEAISHAAHRALVDLFPTQKASFDGLMKSLGYEPADAWTYGSSPSAIGNRAAKRVLDVRRDDGSN